MKHAKIGAVSEPELYVDVIDTYEDFLKLQNAWQELESLDPEGTIFLTWDWMAQVLHNKLYRWSILVVREIGLAGKVVCILPLKYRVRWSASRNEFQTELEAAGRLLFSEYTGFICDPRQEARALAAAAKHLCGMPWTKLSMRYVAQPRRCHLFTDVLAAHGVSASYKDYVINNNETNNLLCPQVSLPNDFDTYLETQIGSSKRQEYNRIKSRLTDDWDYEITCTTTATLDDDLDMLLTHWKSKWVGKKGEKQADRVTQNYRDILKAAHRSDALFLPVLRKGNTVLGALGHVLDDANGSVHFIVAGRNIEAKESFIGSALHFFSIAWAIDQGFTCYDFCHGNEPYKYKYGAKDREVLYFEARRQTLQDDLILDSICIGSALKKVEEFLREGKTDQAARACAQFAKLFS
ncbi:GNAT family N-acetyltransferase [Pseudorhodobacter sp. W20_MBD10_FR17]|uniref:GNAT family N-acetyltransferase n=1 Tax=Pseudorhodobacter sp. W20_MBD10_FR17 TaxID=3240266 RepID=UPI003F977EAC